MTPGRSAAEEELRCIEVAEEVSAYLDGELDEAHRQRVEAHLAGCPGCRAAVDQFKTVKALAGRLTAADVAGVDPLIRDRLRATLRIPRRR